MDVLQGDPGFDHQHHHVIGQVSDLIDRVLLVPVLGSNDDLGSHCLLPSCQTLTQRELKLYRALGTSNPRNELSVHFC